MLHIQDYDWICEPFKENDILVPVTYGKVIGEFVCDEVFKWHCGYDSRYDANCLIAMTCLDYGELYAYGQGKTLYGWHISDLKIYDKPKELSEFVTEGDCDCMNCAECAWLDKGDSMAEIEDDCNLVYAMMPRGVEMKPIFRPPQSWCYVEGMP